MAAALDRIGEHPKAYIIDFTGVSVIDSTAAATIEGFARKIARRGGALYISGATASIRHVLLAQGVRPPQVRYKPKLDDALAAAHKALEKPATPE